ncbi:MAG: hypothetical protein P8Y06_01970 [Patescibacteria group bacterium]
MPKLGKALTSGDRFRTAWRLLEVVLIITRKETSSMLAPIALRMKSICISSGVKNIALYFFPIVLSKDLSNKTATRTMKIPTTGTQRTTFPILSKTERKGTAAPTRINETPKIIAKIVRFIISNSSHPIFYSAPAITTRMVAGNNTMKRIPNITAIPPTTDRPRRPKTNDATLLRILTRKFSFFIFSLLVYSLRFKGSLGSKSPQKLFL